MNLNLEKISILERYDNKEERVFVSTLLDKKNKFDRENRIITTNFLNLNEQQIAVNTLNSLKVPYSTFGGNDSAIKKVLFLLPEYIVDIKSLYNDHIKCIKITSNTKKVLLHKDYMGSIFSLGIKSDVIGDIFVKNNMAYCFCMKDICEYISFNLTKVSNQYVTVEEISLYSDEVLTLKQNFLEKEYIIPSNRVDAILSTVYNLSRAQTKEKIKKGDLYINDKIIYDSSIKLNEYDIVSFRKCGKCEFGQVFRITKGGNLVVNIKLYK